MNDRGSGWRREDSRYVDGLLRDAERERYERALESDGARKARLEEWRKAMGLWRDDATRLASGFDGRRVADRILSGAPAVDEAVRRAAWRYVAAAVVLLGFGLAGSAALGPHPARASALDPGVALRVLEQERLDHQGRLTWEMHPFVGRHFEERGR